MNFFSEEVWNDNSTGKYLFRASETHKCKCGLMINHLDKKCIICKERENEQISFT